MKLNFRQGLVRYPVGIAGTPSYIQKNGQNNSYIDIAADATPVQFTIAHYQTDYIFTIPSSVPQAWGPITANGQTQYLYWDISLLDGSLTYSYTLHIPYVNATAPSNPLTDQHWFDSVNTVMNVWSGTKWLVKLRVFAGTYNQSAILTPQTIGSQVGITGGSYAAGNILLGKNGYPLRDSDGTFVTTESNLIAAATSGQDIKFDAALLYGQAMTNIPAFSLITFTGSLQITPSTYLNTTLQINGMIDTAATIGEVVKVIPHGLIVNQAWNWNYNSTNYTTVNNIGKPLFCDQYGNPTLTPPTIGMIQPIGYVFDTNAIYLDIQVPTRL
jgi:hypothetical protein